MKKTNFLSLDEILCGESSPELNRIKSMANENAYWTSIFEKVLENVANEDSQKLLNSIVRLELYRMIIPQSHRENCDYLFD